MTPWIRRTGWPEYFKGCDREELLESIAEPEEVEVDGEEEETQEIMVKKMEFYRRYGEFPSAGKLTPEDVHISYLIGFLDSLSAGTTFILDHDHGTWSKETSLAGLRGCIDSGVRTWWSYAIHDLGTNLTVHDQFNDLEDIFKMDKGGWQESNVEIGLA